MSKRFEEIAFPEFKREVQLPLFNIQDQEIQFDYKWPMYKVGHNSIEEVLENVKDGRLGIDLEFNTKTKRCSILGVANSDLCASASFDFEQAKKIVSGAKKGKYKLVGFSVMGAEKDILEYNLGTDIPFEVFEDTMILFQLCNSHLCKTEGGKESYEKGSLGFINLYTCSTIYTGITNWKLCRETQCSGPCPKHDVWGYNAIDSWVGLVCFNRLLEEADKEGLTYQFYRDQLKLAYIAQKMRDNGVNVDRKLAEELDNATNEEKELLFNPPDKPGEETTVVPFNPKSSQEILEYFTDNKIKLKDTSKPAIQEYIKKLAYKAGLDYDEYLVSENLSEPEKWLVKLAIYKGLGKGFKGWFADKYFHSDGLLHPRWNTVATQTGRWGCHGPNCMNMPGFKED